MKEREKEYEKLGHRFRALSTIFKDEALKEGQLGGIFQGKSQDILHLSKNKESESEIAERRCRKARHKYYYYREMVYRTPWIRRRD